MAEERRHESADLEDYQVHDASDTLDGAPGDDPLDRGVVAPSRWSAGMRFGTTAEEQEAGESLDQQLAKEEPDAAGADAERSDGVAGAENALDDDVVRFLLDQGADSRTGRIVADDDGSHLFGADDLVARDAGIDGGGATAEEAALHVLAEDEETGPGDGDRP